MGVYRYGFNGKENDNEVKGEGNQQDYGMRVYDPRIGKFLSVDPITKDYPELTPYQFASNSPLRYIDIDGLEGGGWELSSPIYRLKAALEVRNVNTLNAIEQRKISLANMANDMHERSNSNPRLTRTDDCIGCREIANEQYAYNKEMESRASLDPVSYGGPNMGLGLARDPFVQGTATGILTGGVTSMLGTGFVANTPVGQFALKSGMDILAQGIGYGGDFSKVDFFDATMAGIGKPIFSAVVGSAVDVKVFSDKKWSLVMYNKSVASAGLDLGFKIAFGGSKFGLGGQAKSAVAPSLGFKSGFSTKPLGSSLTTTYSTLLNFPISVAGKVGRQAVKAKVGQ